MSFPSPSSRAATRELLTLAWPVVLARIGIMTMGLTDAIGVGNYSSRELAFSSLAMAPTSVMVTTAVGLLLGVQVMTARRLGEGRRADTGAVLRRGLTYALQLGVAAMLALIVVGPWALTQLNLEDGLGEGSRPALIVFAMGMPAYLVSVAAQFFLEALGRPKPGMVAMWVANGVNLALNLLLVPDVLGLGVAGAEASAWATFFARGSLAVFLIIYIASYFIEVGAFALMTVIAGQLGTAETAAWAIVLNISAIVFMVPMGVSSATAVLVGRSYGAHDARGVLRNGLVGIGVISVLTLIVALVVWPTAPLLIGAYNRDPLLAAIAVPALVLATLFFVADGVQVVASQANRAAGDVWWPTIMHFTAYGAIMMPLGWFLAHRIGVDGLVWAVIIASLVSSSLLTGRFVRVARRLA